MAGATGILFDILSVVGVGVVIGLMAFGFFGKKVALIAGTVATVAVAPFAIGFLHDYAVLSGSLIAYAVSTIICYLMSFRSKQRFDFELIKERTGDFDPEGSDASGPDADENSDLTPTSAR